MKRRPNYAQERAEQKRRKQAQRDERLKARAERSEKARDADVDAGVPQGADAPEGEGKP